MAPYVLLRTLSSPSPATTMREGKWEKKAYGKGIELQGKTLGIVGFGRIGQHLGAMAKAIGMDRYRVRHLSTSPASRSSWASRMLRWTSCWPSPTSSPSMLPAVDGGALINADNIAKMKDGVCIINTSRGTNVDEDALLAALESGKVRAAGLDVYADEPATNKALYSHPDGLLHAAHRRCHRRKPRSASATEIVSIIESFGK